MKSYSRNSRDYLIKNGFYNRDNKLLYLEIIEDPGQLMQDWEIFELAAVIRKLYVKRGFKVPIESFLYSLKKSTRVILIKDKAGEPMGTLFASKVSILKYTYYYTERLIMQKNIPLIKLLCAGFLLYNLPDFLKKPIIITTITRRKVVRQLLSLFGNNEIVSSLDWSKLSFCKKWLIRLMVEFSIGNYKYLETKISDMMHDGILRNIYTDTFTNDGNQAVIKENNNFSEKDALFIMNTIPASLVEIKSNFQNNRELIKYKSLRVFMEHFSTGSLLENLELVRREI